MPDTTARLGLPYPLIADAPADIEAAVKPLAQALDPAAGAWVGMISIDTSFPSSPKPGQWFLHGTSKALYVYDGSNWVEIMTGGGTLPIGSLADYSGTTDPVDPSGSVRWVIADGRPLPQSTYPTLYTLLGGASSPWNTFDGQAAPAAGQFRIPRCGRRLFVADSSVSGGGSVPSASGGVALSARARGQAGGKETHTLSSAESGQKAVATNNANEAKGRTHSHGASGSWMLAGVVGTFYGQGAGQMGGYPIVIDPADTDHTHNISGSPATNGHENMPPWMSVGPKIIRVS